MCSGRARVVLHEELPAQLIVFCQQELIRFVGCSKAGIDTIESLAVWFSVRLLDVLVWDLPSSLSALAKQKMIYWLTEPPLLTPSWKWSSVGFFETSAKVFLISISKYSSAYISEDSDICLTVEKHDIIIGAQMIGQKLPCFPSLLRNP